MGKKQMKRKLLSTMLILAMIVISMANSNTKQVQAAVSPEELTSGYLNSSEIYLYLGEQGDKSYDFNVKKEARENGATYSWYINKKKGNPDSVSINTKTGVVTAQEAGAAYIRCKITLSDGTELTPEAKATVRNNITEVKISNIPGNLTITAGLTYNFNRKILNTEAGKGAKTQGITRWEIVDDTAAVDTATIQGIVYPMKDGEFKIRAVCFQSTAKYNLWLTDKEANAALITAASEWSTIKVVSSNETSIASTQEQLNKLLKEDSISKITLSTAKALTFIIPEGNYSKKTLIVNAANADVQNHGIFKEVTINAIKDNTWIEFADGNIFYLNDKVVSLIIDKGVNVKRIVIDTPKCTVNFEILGTVGEIIVRQPSEVNFTGNGAQVPVSVERTAEGSTITTSIPLNLELKAKTDITLNQGAEETIIDKSESKVVVKIENNTNKSNVITTNNNGGEAIGVGKTVISDGAVSSNPTSTTNSPAAISGITITGNAVVGATLTATATPKAATGNYKWISSDTLDGTYIDISGATTSTYVIDVAYAGKFIKATITGTGRYTGTQTSVATEAIVKPLTITAPTLTLTKTYDGNATATVIAGTLNGVIGTDDVTVSAVANYNTAEVGTGKTITVVYTLGGADAAKYVKPVNDTVITGEITAAPLTVTTPTLTQTKAYDGNTTAQVTGGTLHGVVGTDDITVNAVATYNTAEVGTSKTITVVYTLSGADSENYVKPVDYTVTTGTITTTQLTITTPGLTASKAYDGNTTAAVTAGTLTGMIGDEEVTVSAVATYNSSAVGTSKTITVVYTLSGADAGKYVKPANYTIATGTITAAVLTITAPTLTTSKVYDGNTTAVVIPGTLHGIIGSENVTASAAATYNTATLGTGKTITVVYTLGGADAANYVKPINEIVSTGEITAEPLTITDPVLGLTKAYDGTTTATVTVGTLNGVNGADDVTVTAVATYNTATVGTGKTITVVYTLSGADAAKYVKPVNYTVATGAITAITLTASAPTVSLTKVYEGNTTTTVTPGTLGGVIGADQVTLNAVATYDTAAVGTGKTITVVYTLSGAAAGNYVKPANYTVATGAITTTQLTIDTPVLTTSKAYDGNTTAVVTEGTLTGVIGDEEVTVSAVATYNSSAVGTGKTITVVYTLSGANAANYVKPVNYTIANGTITAAQLTITVPTLTTSKAYDGSTTAAVIPGTLQGVVGAEPVTVSAVATYDSTAVGTGKTITVTYTIGGANAANYVKPANYTIATGAITATQLTFSGFNLTMSKIYDGNTSAIITTTDGTLQGVIGADDVSVSAEATYNSATVGSDKTITISYTLSGADAGKYVKPVNYIMSMGIINAALLTAAAPTVSLTKAYDGSTTASVNSGSLSGVIGTDQVALNALATYDTAAAGTGKTITVVYSLTGANAGNYATPANYTIATGAISAAQLTIATPTLIASKTYDGNITAAVTPGTLSGVFNSDTVTVNAVATYNLATIGTGKTITVVYSLSGANAANYVKPADYIVETGEITTAQLTITTPTLTTSKAYDANTIAAVTPGTLQGMVGSETVTVSAEATYNSVAVGTGKTITVVYTIGGANAANYVKPENYTIATSAITAKQLTITASTVTTTKVYDGSTSAAVAPGTLQGVIGTENVTVSAFGYYLSSSVGSNKQICVDYAIGGTNAANYSAPLYDSIFTGSITTAQVALTSITANGTLGLVTTTALNFTFDSNLTALSVDNITVTGATKGILTGTGTTRTLTISNITVANGENIIVAITSPAGYAITPASNNVAVNVETKTVTVDGAQFTYIFNSTGITLINYAGTKAEIIIGYLDEHKVTEIATNAIKNNNSLRKITIGTDITNDSNTVVIKQYAIYGCDSLDTICLGMNLQARSSSIGPTTTLGTFAGDTLAFVQAGTYNLVGTVWTRYVSSDATLKATSKIKGVVVSLGLPYDTYNEASMDLIGNVNISLANANDTTNAGEYITLFDPTSVEASVKAVRYPADGSVNEIEFEFSTLNAYANEALGYYDHFIIKVVAEDGTTKWYGINVAIV